METVGSYGLHCVYHEGVDPQQGLKAQPRTRRAKHDRHRLCPPPCGRAPRKRVSRLPRPRGAPRLRACCAAAAGRGPSTCKCFLLASGVARLPWRARGSFTPGPSHPFPHLWGPDPLAQGPSDSPPRPQAHALCGPAHCPHPRLSGVAQPRGHSQPLLRPRSFLSDPGMRSSSRRLLTAGLE